MLCKKKKLTPTETKRPSNISQKKNIILFRIVTTIHRKGEGGVKWVVLRVETAPRVSFSRLIRLFVFRRLFYNFIEGLYLFGIKFIRNIFRWKSFC